MIFFEMNRLRNVKFNHFYILRLVVVKNDCIDYKENRNILLDVSLKRK